MVTQNSLSLELFSSAAALRIAAAVLQALIWLAASPATHADEYDGAIQRCAELLPEFDQHPPGHPERSARRDARPAGRGPRSAGNAATPSPGGDPEGWIICFFLPRSETGGAWQIDLMDTQKYGKLKRYDVQQLYKLRWLNRALHPEPDAGGDAGTRAGGHVALFPAADDERA